MTTPLRFDDSQREGTDIALYKRLTRDVCFLFHELADYGHIMGDLNYAEDYPLPYWELLNRVDTGRPDDRLIRSGILILLMAMLRDQFDGSGSWISKYLDQVTSALTLFVPEDDDMLRLCDSVSHGVSLLRNNCGPDEPFEAASVWAYDAVVRRYFLNAAQMR